MYESFDFNEKQRKFPEKTMATLTTIVNDVNYGSLTRLGSESKILTLLDGVTDNIVIRLVNGVKTKIKEYISW